MEEVAAWIVDVVGLEEEAYTRLIIHAGSVSGTIPVMGYESKANHFKYIACTLFSLRDDLFDTYIFSCHNFFFYFCINLVLPVVNFTKI